MSDAKTNEVRQAIPRQVDLPGLEADSLDRPQGSTPVEMTPAPQSQQDADYRALSGIEERSVQLQDMDREAAGSEEVIRKLAREDVAALAGINDPAMRAIAAGFVGESSSVSPTYGEEIARVSPDIATEAMDAFKAELPAMMEKEAKKGALLADQDQAVAELDARMAASKIGELGWRDRDDISTLMEDMQQLAQRDWHAASELWEKHRPGEVDKPKFLDGDDVPEKSGAPAKQDLEQSAADTTPEALKRRFLQADTKFYFRDQENRLAFEDKGRRLATEHNDPEVARAMVLLAESKGWKAIAVKGTEDFRREAWLQASLKGMQVSGYEARDVDRAKLEELRSEQANAGKVNVIEQGRAREQARSDAEVRGAGQGRADSQADDGLTKQERQAIAALKAALKGRGDSDQAVDMAATVAAERFANSRAYVGKVIEYGEAPYEFKKDEQKSYYVKLETPAGERVVWGVDLERALKDGKAAVGDDVALAYQGRQPVTIERPVRDQQGRATGEVERVDGWRNAWDVRRVEDIREDALQRLQARANAGNRQPLVKVYDAAAQRSGERSLPTHDKSRDRSQDRARG